MHLTGLFTINKSNMRKLQRYLGHHPTRVAALVSVLSIDIVIIQLNLKISILLLMHFKRLGSRCFHDLFNHYLCFFSKHNEFCKTEASAIWVNFSRVLREVLLKIFTIIICQWDFVMGKKP